MICAAEITFCIPLVVCRVSHDTARKPSVCFDAFLAAFHQTTISSSLRQHLCDLPWYLTPAGLLIHRPTERLRPEQAPWHHLSPANKAVTFYWMISADDCLAVKAKATTPSFTVIQNLIKAGEEKIQDLECSEWHIQFLFAQTLKFPSSNLTINLENLRKPASKLPVYKTKHE